MSDSPKEWLARFGLTAKKSWGQNFLSDPSVLSNIVEAAQIGAADRVVELGPGLGHLTRALLATGAEVVAVERDRDMVRVLQSQNLPRLRVVEANAANIQFADIAQRSPVVVIGNLPYHLTSPILFSVLDQQQDVSRAVFTIQTEVAERLSAAPGSRTYGLLTVLLGLFFDVETVARLPAALFYPPPKVDSAVIRLSRLPEPRATIRDSLHFRQVVKASFAQRRKTLLNSLKSDPRLGSPADLALALETAGIDGGRRAETLSVIEFAALSRALPAPK